MPPGALLNPCPTFEMIRMQNEGLGGACPGGKRGLSATIPVVFITSDDPVRLGLVASLAQPGSNLTGSGGFESASLQVNSGMIGQADVERSTTLFAREVMPHFRN
jgi:hypothetical protein